MEEVDGKSQKFNLKQTNICFDTKLGRKRDLSRKFFFVLFAVIQSFLLGLS